MVRRCGGQLPFETAALRHKNSRGTPLEEEDDGDEHGDFPEHGVEENLLQRLVGKSDPERAHDGARKIADATDHDGHEAIDDVVLAERRTDVTDLTEKRARESRESAPEAKGEHVY